MTFSRGGWKPPRYPRRLEAATLPTAAGSRRYIELELIVERLLSLECDKLRTRNHGFQQ
jgi:hypothetical protein